MNTHYAVLLIMLGCAIPCSAQSPQRNSGNKADVVTDIQYVADGHRSQRLDLYLPKSKKVNGKLPLVVWIHGGAWRGGDKKFGKTWRPLLDEGVAVASINYRLSAVAHFPAQIQDCKAAIRWLRENGEQYNLNTERIGAWGSSAGGHLAALLGTSGDVDELEPEGSSETSSRVQVVCNWFGPIDFLTMNQQSGPNSTIDHDAIDSPESLLIGGAIQDNPRKCDAASPAFYISPDDPPMLHVHGDRDNLVPVKQSKKFHDALTEAGLTSELLIVEGGGHGGFRDRKYQELSIEFLKKHLIEGGEDSTDD